MLYCTRCGCEDQEKLHLTVVTGNVFSNNCQCCNYEGVVKEFEAQTVCERCELVTNGELDLKEKCPRCGSVGYSSHTKFQPTMSYVQFDIPKVNKYDDALLKTAYTFAELSSCERLKVGAVIAKDGRPLVTGYNGTISGLDNCCEEETNIICEGCGGSGIIETAGVGIWDCPTCGGKKVEMKTSDFVVHAEQNAILYAAKHGIATEGCDIYVTHAPCSQCAKAIASAGIKRVIFSKEYRDSSGVEFLKKCGLVVEIK